MCDLLPIGDLAVLTGRRRLLDGRDFVSRPKLKGREAAAQSHALVNSTSEKDGSRPAVSRKGCFAAAEVVHVTNEFGIGLAGGKA